MSDGEGQVANVQVLVADVATGVAVVSLLGEHDIATVDELRSALASLLREGADVVVDLTETEFVDSSTMHVLGNSQRLASQHGAKMSFQLGTRAMVKRVFALTGALEAWPVYGTRADAIDAVSRAHNSANNLGRVAVRAPWVKHPSTYTPGPPPCLAIRWRP